MTEHVEVLVVGPGCPATGTIETFNQHGVRLTGGEHLPRRRNGDMRFARTGTGA